MRKFSKVVQVFVGTTEEAKPSFTKKTQSSTAAALKWLLMKTVTWWGVFGQVGTCGVRSIPGLGHGEEISVVVKNKFCNGRVFVVYGSDVCVSDIQTVGGPGFGLISLASRSRMKRRGGDRAGGINIEDLMLKCRQKVVVGGLKGKKQHQDIECLN